MSMISSHLRSENEETINRRSALALTIVIAVSVGGLSALLGDSGENNNTDDHHASITDDDTGPQPGLKTPNESESKNVLNKRLHAIEVQLPAKTSSKVRSELDRVADIIEDENWKLKEETDLPFTVTDRLNTIEQQVAALTALTQPSAVEMDLADLEPAIVALAKSVQEKTADKIEDATKKVQKKRQPELRRVELELRDRKDTAAKLRGEIARLQREQMSNREKAIRAAALKQDMPDIRKYLPAFTTPGHYQPNSTSSAWSVELTVEAKPVSLERLDKLGALKQTIEGLDRLYAFGGGRTIDLNNDRPQGSFPDFSTYYIKQREIRTVVERAQELLREHGQAMIEAGLLSP